MSTFSPNGMGLVCSYVMYVRLTFEVLSKRVMVFVFG